MGQLFRDFPWLCKTTAGVWGGKCSYKANCSQYNGVSPDRADVGPNLLLQSERWSAFTSNSKLSHYICSISFIKLRRWANNSYVLAQRLISCGPVVCLASTGLHALPSTSGHDPNGMSDALLGDLLPQLGEGLSQLMNSLWCVVGAVEAAKKSYCRLSPG